MSNVAVLIDADNVSPKWIKFVLDEAATLGTLALKRIYGDFSKPYHQEWREVCAELAIQPYQQYPNTKGKNASDIALVIDAMDLLHANRYAAFCLVSSDSDFSRLATRLRENGAQVWGFGEQKTPKAFVAACSKFVYVEVLAMAEEQADSNDPAKPGGGRPQLQAFDKKVKAMLKTAVQNSAEDDGWANLGQVGRLINKQQPDFDSRNFGFPKLSNMVAAAGIFEIQKNPKGGILLRAKQNAPAAKQ